MYRTYGLPCLPSTALPASGSLGIISALVFRHPHLSFDHANVEKKSVCTIVNSRYLYTVSKVTVNKITVVEVENTDQGITLDGKSFDWDIVNITDGYFHIIQNKKSYKAEVVKADKTTKTFTFKINNNIHTVEVKDKFDLLLEKLGMNTAASGKLNTVKAPMPGLIIELKVAVGDSVKAGDQLLILEAMKMENILKSSGDGVVKSLKVKKGDIVEKNQVLIEF